MKKPRLQTRRVSYRPLKSEWIRLCRYRSARTGRFVTRAYAKKHPATTVREAI